MDNRLKFILVITGLNLIAFEQFAFAQIRFSQHFGQQSWLRDQDPKLAKNKKIVYDFWREVLEAGHLDLAPQYMTETYIQPNPNVPTGSQGFINFFSIIRKPQPIVDSIKGPLIAITAEVDLVVLVFKRELSDTKDATKKYTTTAFEMLRVEDGKIAEHWDAAAK